MRLLRQIKLPARTFSRIDVDFLRYRKKLHARDLVLISLGILLFSFAVGHYLFSTYQLAKINAAIYQNSEEFSNKANSEEKLPNPEEIDAVQKSLNQLSIPWIKLFSALEAIHSDKVVLLSVEPDADKRTVRITAEAADVYQMLDYLRALAVRPYISNVVLINQEMQEGEQNQPVRFILTAGWGLQ